MAATVKVNLRLVFQNGELRLEETETSWKGFRRIEKDGEFLYFWVVTDSPHDELRDGVRVGERAVRQIIDATTGGAAE